VSLKFSPGNHQYKLDGKPVTGVTTLIKGGLPAPALVYWSAKMVAEYVADNEDAVAQLRAMGRNTMVAALKGIPWDTRDKAALKGTDIHALAERVVHGEEIDVPPEFFGHVQGYADWLDKFDAVPVLAEKSCANRKHWYAGRFDLIADLPGARWLLDVKTGKNAYPDAAIQLDAYRNCEFYVTDDDPETEYPMPEGIERLGVLHVTESGTTLVPMQSDGAPFRDFLHCAWITKRDQAIKAYKLEPIHEVADLGRKA
jgi:hypothetical protein